MRWILQWRPIAEAEHGRYYALSDGHIVVWGHWVEVNLLGQVSGRWVTWPFDIAPTHYMDIEPPG